MLTIPCFEDAIGFHLKENIQCSRNRSHGIGPVKPTGISKENNWERSDLVGHRRWVIDLKTFPCAKIHNVNVFSYAGIKFLLISNLEIAIIIFCV